MKAKKAGWMVKLLFIIATLICFSPAAWAIGIAPSTAIYDFTPGKMITYSIDIVNNGHEELEVLLYPRGEMSENVRISSQMLKMAASEETKRVNVFFTMPDSLEKAGRHEIEIVAVGSTPTPAGQKAAVKADVAVISKLIIDVPYPDKYAEARVYVLDTEQGKPFTVNIPVFNRGKQDIDQAYADVTIYASDGTKIEELTTDKRAIGAGQESKFIAQSTKQYDPGAYTAKATVHYDGKETSAEASFSIGELSIDIRSLVVDQFTLGQVAKFDILLYNNWNTELKNVYAQMQIYGKDNKQYTDFKTVATDIPASGIGRLEGYWYTQGVEPGIYTAKITLYYANRIAQKEFELEVQPNRIIARDLATGESISAADEVNLQKNGILILTILIMAAVIGVLVHKLRKRQPPQAAPTIPQQPASQQTAVVQQAAVADAEQNTAQVQGGAKND